MDRPLPGFDRPDPEEDERLAALRAFVRRRIASFLAGLSIFILAAQLNTAALGWPGWLPGVLEGVAVLLMLAGPFGLGRSLGCAGQLLVLLWLGSLTCGAEPWRTESGAAFARTLLVAGALALIVFIWRRRGPRPEHPEFPGHPGAPPSPEPSPGDIIDVEGHEGPPRPP